MEKKKFSPLRTGTLPINNLYGVTSKTIQVSEKHILVIKLTLLDAAFGKLQTSSAKLGTQLQNYDRSSVLTPEIQEADKSVNYYFSDLKRKLTTDKKSSDAVTSMNATPLYHAVKPYWNVTNLRLITQMEKMQLMFLHIDGTPALINNLTALNYTNLWNNLKQSAKNLKDIYDTRITEIANRGDAPFKMRSEVASDYDIFCDLVIQALAAAPSAELEIMFDEMNEIRHGYAPEAKKELMHHISISDIPAQVWTGEYLSPTAAEVHYTEVDEIPVKLRAGKDFINTYEDNINPGTGWIIFLGRGKYAGRAAFPFNIVKP
jgi:hypothetical protein